MVKKIIGRNISILYRHKYQYADLKLKKYSINKVQAEVLLFIRDHNGANHKQINEFFLFNKATITKTVSSLEKLEYVIRTSSSEDKRHKIITLTEKGESIIPKILEALMGWEKVMLKDINEEDIEKITTILVKMVENVTDKIEE